MKCTQILSRSGSPTLQVDGVFLHSRYDPQREALTFLDQFADRLAGKLVIVIGEGIPYVSRAISADPSRVEPVIAVLACASTDQPTEELAEQPSPAGITVFHPTDSAITYSVRRAVRDHIHPALAGLVEVVVWPAARRAAPSWTAQVEAGVLGAIQDLQSELATVASFGLQWLRTALRTTLLYSERHSVSVAGEQIAVATSGPSTALLPSPPALASSSALLHLISRALTPSVVVHSDSGFWASRYLTDYNAATMTLAAPVRAAPRPAHRSGRVRWIPLSTAWIGEELAPDRLEWLAVGEQPSVGVTLLTLAATLAPRAPLTLAGFDLCSYGFREHAAPHLNEAYILRQTSRIAPLPAHLVTRVAAVSASRGAAVPPAWPDGTIAWQNRALDAFAEPVRHVIDALRAQGRHVHHLAPSPAWPDEIPESTAPSERADVSVQTHRRPHTTERIRHARETLIGWREAISRGTGSLACAPRFELDLLLHLAPVATVGAVAGRSETAIARQEAERAIDRLILRIRSETERIDE